MTKITKPNTQALRGPALTFTADPFEVGVESAMRYESDAIVAMAGGKITHMGPAKAVRSRLPPGTRIKANGNDTLMLAGFIDSHVHFPQTPMIAAYGEQLLDWLNKYTFPTEQKYADKMFAAEVARFFCGKTCAMASRRGCVYCTVYPQSVDALFEEAEKLGCAWLPARS